jgi:hypothetical protein
MNQEKDEYHALIRSLKHRWDDEDEARDELERRARKYSWKVKRTNYSHRSSIT